MLQLSRSVIAVLALIQFMPVAAAHDSGCADVACLPLQPPVHRPPGNFHPTSRDGMPMVEDFQEAPEGFYGIACHWAWRPVATPTGVAWGLARDCLSY